VDYINNAAKELFYMRQKIILSSQISFYGKKESKKAFSRWLSTKNISTREKHFSPFLSSLRCTDGENGGSSKREQKGLFIKQFHVKLGILCEKNENCTKSHFSSLVEAEK
jgi:hypothetical protein